MIATIIGSFFIFIIAGLIFTLLKHGNFERYKKQNPDKILPDGTVICKYCGSHKTVIYRRQKRCQTCTKVLYNAS